MNGKQLFVDLTSGEVRAEEQEVCNGIALGGKALALSILESRLEPKTPPLAPGNLMILTPSPLSAYGFSGSNRFGVFAKSPLTGGLLESYSGGTLARTLYETGWGAVVITGASPTPVRLHLTEEGAVLLPADGLWSLDAFAADDALSEELPSRSGSMVIGVAGENLSPVSSVQAEKYHALGRGGLGAVFGSKRLKAITVTSPGARRRKGDEAFESVRRKVSQLATDSPVAKAYRSFGTAMMVAILNEAGGFPADFWRAGTVSHRGQLEAEDFPSWATVETGTCPPCPMRCRRILTPNDGDGHKVHGPEYESLYSFGGLCMVEHARDVLELHQECNRLGLDVISAGNLLALGARAGETGRAADAPAMGDVPGFMRLLDEMAERSTELGDLLARGVKVAAPALGLEEEAIHVKGMEPAGYDPRALRGMALAYATSPRGACHLRATFYKPILGGLTKDLNSAVLADLFADFENRLFLFDCLVICRFYRDFLTWDNLAAIAAEYSQRPVTVHELKAEAERLITRTRRLNQTFGFTAADDQLPRRFFTEGIEDKAPLDEQEFADMLTAYYRRRGWGDDGRPPETPVVSRD